MTDQSGRALAGRSSKAITFTDAETHDCPFAAYDTLRETAPAYLDPVTGHYVLTNYEDVRKVLMKFRQYSNAVGLVGIRESEAAAKVAEMYAKHGWPQTQMMQSEDPPVHKQKRTHVDKAFARWNVEKVEPQIEAFVNELIDGFIDDGSVEFVSRFAVLLSISIITQQLGFQRKEGVSIEDYVSQVRIWSDMAIEELEPMLTDERFLEITEEMIRMQHFLAANIERVEENPDDTLISKLTGTIRTEDGDVDFPEILTILKSLLVAGNETTRYALASGMRALIENPDIARELVDNPEKVSDFVEETLRYYAPVQTLFRRTTEDVEIQGVEIPAGSRIEVRFGAANRDPKKFECPEQFRLGRENIAGHMTFGAGIHSCIGMQLARAELNLAFENLVRRMKNYRLAKGSDSLAPAPAYLTFGLDKLLIAFDKR